MAARKQTLSRLQRELIIDEVVRLFERSQLVLVSHVGQVPRPALDKFRAALVEKGGGVKSVKSSLGRVAASRLGLEHVGPLFNGPAVLVHSGEEKGVDVAKVALKFASERPEDFLILGGKLEGQQIAYSHVPKLVTLNTEQVQGEMLGAMHPGAYAGQLLSFIDPSTHYRAPPVSQHLLATLETWVQQQRDGDSSAGAAG